MTANRQIIAKRFGVRAKIQSASALKAAMIGGTNNSGARSKLAGASRSKRNSTGRQAVTVRQVKRKMDAPTARVHLFISLLFFAANTAATPRPASTATAK